ncbi:SLATT domain-containing protein [Pontibacillus sp. ALD_SL1]|uniref:SLATT domain-containing protein n=1 Tax=Pontibacillus sp. ALD_SL1 TaxID=2777185 RepID=UPI001A962704|nr:SLATT domain-containing protein [Pontibacillus sp. ALD_SL1]QSS98753.1 SLATT domain-containing protein [Pontibacillus sp. ALD_SL1]
MDKSSLLKSIAIKGYDVGFGAKKHFATFDLACKAPNLIAILTLTAGVIQLGFDIPLTLNKSLSVVLISIGIISIFLNYYGDEKRKEYSEAGVEITNIYQSLRDLYYSVQGTEDRTQLSALEEEYKELVERFNNIGITQQMMFSDWYAHYKFFVQLETDWIEEQRPFRFKDKVPLLIRWGIYFLSLCVALSIIIGLIILSNKGL